VDGGNAAIKRDEAGNIKPIKPEGQRKKVDGVVATVMALGRAILQPHARI
jgi:phage terminase large subunit-like protein